ncbi:MAG TPA: uracil-DNA glycosylase family protein [Candidatus Methylomirabilis sp.]|nr:uracil-DNA glycosylase family protein [Candidatus Methylomirabilis sp.]
MAERLPEFVQKKISERLSFYDDLGISLFYKDRSSPASEPAPAMPEISASLSPEARQQISYEERSLAKSIRTPESAKPSPAAQPASRLAQSTSRSPFAQTAPPASVRKLDLPSAPSGPSLFEAVNRIPDDSLLRIRTDIGDCTRCKLHKGRHTIVFGDGNLNAQLVFVGEGPGHDEDMQGLPFVGRAGKLLTQMIEAMGLERKDVYICNVVKCRPPENRLPERDEVAECSPFLFRQLDAINPKVIVCLGACAAQTLLETNRGISHFRGEWLDFRGRKLMATYHPAYLLRNPSAKSEVWKDLQKVMAVLGLPARKIRSAEAGKS